MFAKLSQLHINLRLTIDSKQRAMVEWEEGSDAVQTGGVALNCYSSENTSLWELYNHVTLH